MVKIDLATLLKNRYPLNALKVRYTTFKDYLDQNEDGGDIVNLGVRALNIVRCILCRFSLDLFNVCAPNVQQVGTNDCTVIQEEDQTQAVEFEAEENR